MSQIEKMSEEEFIKDFGLSPDRCRDLMERVRQIINTEVHEVIAHADYYVDPVNYCGEEFLKEQYGEDVFEKDNEDDDGYTKLYEYGRQSGAVSLFMSLISWHTTHGGHTSAIRACDLMDLAWEADR